MPPMQIDRSTLVGGAYHEVDPRICYVLVNFTQEDIDGAWEGFCDDLGFEVEKVKPKDTWWRRLLHRRTQ